VLVAAPFFVFVGAGGTWWRRGWSAALGALIPVGLLLAYNLMTSGEILHPAYDYLYRLEALAYPSLGYHPGWGVEDARYLPQNAAIMFLTMPDLAPSTLPDSPDTRRPSASHPRGPRLFDASCRWRCLGHRDERAPREPRVLFLIPALRRYGRSRR
jgi:hypothetical protein